MNSREDQRVAFRLPEKGELVQWMRTDADFAVERIDSPFVLMEPAEGARTPRNYFEMFRLGSAVTNFAEPALWEPVRANPPRDIPANFAHLSPENLARLEKDRSSNELLAVAQSLGYDLATAGPDGVPAAWQKYLPRLFQEFPDGSLWYMVTDNVLVSRLAFLRVALQLTLTPDIDYAAEGDTAPQYFGLHTITNGTSFDRLLDYPLLAITPTTMGLTFGSIPNSFVFLFGEPRDLRHHRPINISARFSPSVNSVGGGAPGIKFPIANLPVDMLETLLAWWPTRLNILYGFAADPTNFADTCGIHDVAAQAGWLMTLERMLADASALLSAVDSTSLLRMQAGFDLLDKAGALLSPSVRGDGNFRRFLQRDAVMGSIHRAFDELPVQWRERFKSWATETFDRFYEDVRRTTMRSRASDDGVLVAKRDPNTTELMSWDQYVSRIVRAARNSSHGLQDLMAGPDPDKPKDADVRLLLATNSGRIPDSFYEAVAVVFYGLMADAQRLCTRTWFDN